MGFLRRLFGGERGGAGLDDARALVVHHLRQLAPHAGALPADLAARLAGVRQRWEAQETARERGEDPARIRGGLETIARELAEVRVAFLDVTPDSVRGAWLDTVEEELENAPAGARLRLEIELFAARVRPDGAEACRRALPGLLERVVARRSPIATVLVVRQLYQAEKVLGALDWIEAGRREALAAWDGAEGPDYTELLTMLIEAQTEWDDLDAAAATLARLEHDDLQRGLASLVAAQARLGRIDEARATLARITSPDLRASAQAELVEHLVRERSEAEALAVVRALEDPDARREASLVLAAHRARAGRPEEAEALLDELGIELDDAAHEQIVLGLVEAGRLDEAAARIDAFDPTSRPGVCSAVATRLTEAPDLEAALAFADALPDDGARIDALQGVAWRMVAKGARDEARAVLARIVDLCSRVAAADGLTPGLVDSSMLARAALGDALGASDMARGVMLGQSNDPERLRWALSRIAWAAARMRDLDGLDALLVRFEGPNERTGILLGAAEGLGLDPARAGP